MLKAFAPLAGEHPRVLVLGTFPSPLSREKGEYYGNPRNQFWRMVFDVFSLAGGAAAQGASYAQKQALLLQNGVALWDVLGACEAKNALDSSIQNEVYNTALPEFIQSNSIPAVLFNGGNAFRFYKRGIGGTECLNARVMPSTSPAHARMRYEEKLAAWRAVLSPEGVPEGPGGENRR